MALGDFSGRKLSGIVFFVGLSALATAATFYERTPSPISASSTAASPRTTFCPLKTPEEWQEFLERQSNTPEWVKTCEDSTCNAEFVAYVQNNIKNVFDACTSFFAAHPGIDRCTSNMRRFTVAWLEQHSPDSYGFTVDNRTYLANEESPDKPEGMMKVPDYIVRALPDRGEVEEAARTHGLKYLTHDSALGGTRTFIFYSDPDGKFDRWMLLNLKDGDKAIKDHTPLSVLAVQKKDAVGNPLPQVRLHFRDYDVARAGSRYKLELSYTANGKCYSCHPNGVRQLIARHTPVLVGKPVFGEPDYQPSAEAPSPPDFAYRRLMEFNRRLRGYGRPDWAGMVVPADHGPALGKSQGCMDCHDGHSRAELNISTSVVQIEQKSYYELGMPYDTDLPRLLERKQMKNPALTPEEEHLLEESFDAHRALVVELENSRLPELREWFTETPCSL